MFTLACGSIPTAITQTINEVYKIMLIVIPVLVVIFALIDLGKAVIAGKQDEIKSATGMLIKRILICAIVFLVATLVSFVLGIVKTGNTADAISCLNDLFSTRKNS